jgi:hypothetical protein
MPGSAAKVIASFTALSSTFGVAHVSAQPVASRTPVAMTVEASMRAGSVVGIVKDERGSVVSGVAVTAIGTTQALARPMPPVNSNSRSFLATTSSARRGTATCLLIARRCVFARPRRLNATSRLRGSPA